MPVASLTQDEAAERAALLTVHRYDLEVDFTGLLEGDTVRTTSTIAFAARTPGAATFVDLVAEIRGATLNGADLDLATHADGRLPLPGLAEENILVVTATQSHTDAGQGILRTVDPTDGLVYVWTTFEPDEARRLWACFDQPDLKAVHRFVVDAPASWTITSNTEPESVEAASDDTRRWTFAPTPPLSTYVAVVNGGPFHELRSARGGYDLGLFCRQSLATFLDRDAEELFDLTARGLAWFGEQFALPFPQERYDQVFVPGMGGAMENWGGVTHTDAFVFRSAPTHRQRARRANVILHEMAHMWFGDLVTMRWWNDLWLNEAFASWAAAWASEHATEFTDAWAQELFDSKVAGYEQDRGPATHPIRGVVPDVQQAMANFDDITYDKGQAVLHQLAAYLGEEAFVAGLAAYFAEHRWGNTTLDDLMGAFSAASGRDLTAWTTDWLDRAGTDTLVLTGSTLTATAPDGGSPRPHRLEIAGYEATADGLLPAGRTAVEVTGAETAVDLPPGSVFEVNSGDLTFAAVRADPDSLATLRQRAGRLPDALGRALAVTTAWDMLVKGELAAAELVETVLGVLAAGPQPAIVESLLNLGVEAAGQWAPDAQVDDLTARVAEAAAALLDDPDARLPALRALAATATTPAHLALLAGAAEDDVELAWRVLARRAELGDVDPAAVAALQARDPDPESFAAALVIFGAQPDAAAKEEFWQAMMVEKRIPVGPLLARGAEAFWRREQADLLGEYPDRYLAALDDLSDAGMMTQLALIRFMFPAAIVDAAFLDRAAAVAAADGVNPTVRSALLTGIDTGRRVLRSRGA